MHSAILFTTFRIIQVGWTGLERKIEFCLFYSNSGLFKIRAHSLY